MSLLQELNEENQLARLEAVIIFQETELKEIMSSEMRINEHDENMLNRILDDIDARFADAKNALSDANRSRGEEKRSKMSSAMGEMNKIRNILNIVIKKYFPQGDGGEASAAQTKKLDHYVSPRQAAEALGIHPSKLQNLIYDKKLRMYNDNGNWALKGDEVQKLIDNGVTAK